MLYTCCVCVNMMLKPCLNESPNILDRCWIHCSFFIMYIISIIDVHESVGLIKDLELELKSKRMLYSKQHLKLSKVIGEG